MTTGKNSGEQPNHDERSDPDRVLRRLFERAIDAVSAQRVLPAHLPEPPKGRTVIVAIGKAASAMADVAAERWRGPLSGVAITRYGHALHRVSRRHGIEQIEAGHPIPDEMSVAGARRALELVRDLGADDLALVLLSGGGSSLCCLPIENVSLQDKQRITSELLNAGASIQELNTVRKWLSQIKGGRLAAAAAPARVETLIVSDVISNDPSMIASGPTIPREESFAELQRILARYRLELPPAVLDSLRQKANTVPGPSHPGEYHIVATPADALGAAASEATSSGFDVHILGDSIAGEARDAAIAHAGIARAVRNRRPTVILSGGEVTVAVKNRKGVGGPNTEFLLALAIALDGAPGIRALACDTDGYDGIGNNAGAIIGPDTLVRAKDKDVSAAQALAANNSYRFFEALGDLVVTGPTQTNVSDFRAIVIDGDNDNNNDSVRDKA